jgi:hypothetical protein
MVLTLGARTERPPVHSQARYIELSQGGGMFDCAAMLAVFVAGMTIQQLDRTRVYEIPRSQMQRLSMTERTFARACAVKHGIRYRIVNDRHGGLN